MIGLALLIIFFVFTPKIANAVSAPTILSPQSNEITTAKPIITGVSFNDTLIEIFIDGAHAGNIQTTNDLSGTGNFAWQVREPLIPGRHAFLVRAVNAKTQEKSLFSTTKTITLIPFGTPTLRLLDGLTLGKPFTFVEGVAHNNSTVHLFIDGALVDSFKLGADESGSVGFKFTLSKPLFSGKHTLYAQGEDVEGKKSLPSKVTFIAIATFPAPTLVSPVSGSTTLEALPTISGIAFNNSKIHIYVDDTKKEAVINVINSPSGIGNFSYTLGSSLERGKYHRLSTKAEAPDGRISNSSNIATLYLEHYFVAPTILAIKGASSKPTITGLAHNQSTIHIFVDNKLDTTVAPKSDPSGTLYFEVPVSKKLAPGIHKITAQAFDSVQKPSKMSVAKYHTYSTKPSVPVEQQPAPEGTQTPKEEPKKQEENISTKDEIEGKTKLDEKEPVAKESGGEKKPAEKSETTNTEQKKSETDTSDTTTNLPLVLGLVILIGLAILFIVWYLGQKRRLLNEGIDKLFSDQDKNESSPKVTLFDSVIEEPSIDITLEQKPEKDARLDNQANKNTDTKTKDNKPSIPETDTSNDIPPPPPAI